MSVPGTGPARADDMLLLPSAWTYEAGQPKEAWIPGFWASRHLWDSHRLGLFLFTLVWVRGTSFSRSVLHKHLWRYRWVRGARVCVEVRYRAHRPGLRGIRGVSTSLYHRLSVHISLICRVCFCSCTCCLN